MIEVEVQPARSSSRPSSSGGPRRRRGRGPKRRPTRRRIAVRRTVALVLVVALGLTAWSLGSALAAPTGDDAVTKLAEWARDHGLGPVVTLAETVQYKLNPPVTGGTPDTAQLAAGAHEKVATTGSAATSSLLPRFSTPVTPALPGEGVWVPVTTSAAGPLVQETFVRPDTVHTSYLAGVVWLSHRLQFVLHPGFEDPGTSGFTQPDAVTPREYAGLVATFNGGFKTKDAHGGIYDHGTTVGTLTPGAASLVIYKDGHATVGTWGSDVSLTPDVAYVRQNLQPLVQNGALVPNLDANVEATWGATIGGAYAVWRSGIGVTRTGDLVYVAGDALTVGSLADLLHRAGAVTAMQLDINKAWVSFMYYSHSGNHMTPHKVGQFQRPADRYLNPTSRDFFAVYAS